MSVLRSIVKRVILEAPGQQPTAEDLALAYYAMSIAPSSVVKQILSNNAPILMYVRVFTDSSGNPIRLGSLNKIAMQMGVPTPTPSLMQKIRKTLGSFNELKQKVQKSHQDQGRSAKLVRAIAGAEIDERFFPRELLFTIMQLSSPVQSVTSINALPKELRDVISSMRATLKEINQTYRSPSVAQASALVRDEIDSLVAQLTRTRSRVLGSHVSRDFDFTDTKEQDAAELSYGHDLDDPLESVEGPRRASSKPASSAAWRRPRSLAEALLGNDDDEDPYAFDIGSASTFDTPVDTLAGIADQQPDVALKSSGSLSDDSDDKEPDDFVTSLLDDLDDLGAAVQEYSLPQWGSSTHYDVDVVQLAASVHELINAMNEEMGESESIDASSVTP